jgi:hypothetical protein
LNFNGGSRRKQPFFPFTSQKQKINLLFLIVKLKIYYKSKIKLIEWKKIEEFMNQFDGMKLIL